MSKSYRVGRLTAGLLFIGLGISLLLKIAFDFSILNLVYYGWPLLLILLGGEMMISTRVQRGRGEETGARYDVMGLMILILFTLFSMGIALLEETGLTALAKQTAEARYYDVETPIYTLENLKGVKEIQVVAHQGNINLRAADQDRVMALATYSGLLAGSFEEAAFSAEETIKMVKEGENLYLFLRHPVSSPSSSPWFYDQAAAQYTLILPADLPLSVNTTAADLSIHLEDPLDQDWIVTNQRGATSLYVKEDYDLNIAAQGLGNNLNEMDAWAELNKDLSRGQLSLGDGKAQLRLHTDSGLIRLHTSQ